jgi:hypothetical protein
MNAKEHVARAVLYCFAAGLAAVISSYTRIQGDFPILFALGIIMVQNLFIRWALARNEPLDRGDAEIQAVEYEV